MRQALVNENADLVRREPPLRHAHHRQRHARARRSSATSSTRNRTIPSLVTTSRLLSTGVDAQTCRLIVLDREVGSMTEFKQIVGRGTRVHEDTKKYYFTLIDFRRRDQPLRRPRLRRRAGADLRAGRGRSRRPARRRAADRRRR